MNAKKQPKTVVDTSRGREGRPPSLFAPRHEPPEHEPAEHEPAEHEPAEHEPAEATDHEPAGPADSEHPNAATQHEPASTVARPTDDPTTAAIATTGLTRSYGDVVALEPIDLRIPVGQRVALVGHNGSGKTTFIRMVTGTLDPTEGTATVAGHAVGTIEARAALSYLADQPVFYDDLSLVEHLEYVARLHGRSDWIDDALALMERLGIEHRADDLPITFSRGLKQKAAICLAFIRPFDVLVVDEPFVGLDAPGRHELLALFDDAQQQGKTLLVATHELDTVAASDRLIALANGSVIHDGSPDVDVDALVDTPHPV